ncbi:hypothetical protein [Paenibacillus wenxiniae]|uniref:Uncharacterized protein n=1 Tax=Paenibacillus wenxiniae TaxID=1636843 RepID=A0ABW4RLS0_9BACL
MSWKLSLGVILAAIGLSALSGWWLGGLVDGGSSFNLIVVFMLYTSLVIKAMNWLSYNKEEHISYNLQRLAAYVGIYAISFVVSGLIIGVSGRDAIMLAVISVGFGAIYSLNDLKYVFRQGWSMFLTVMIIPVFLVVWLIMYGLTMDSWFNIDSMYDYFIVSGVVYWLLVICTLALFSRYIVKQPQDSSSAH